ncbi:YbjN domain-containing protein [Deinococcus sp. KSM4-11]|uniref:YbjN domain-containing protein n=1 Tax=Deinococcus sp. KSM4-11 TaxID=2568654 RepID=UPI0010A45502|nr:YbjN domain-containing protein [Deinococcus sp. KSM4-11]THF83981.1 YbjN domain-containing protein [Deinococcus sp. KSM4-11]
MKYFPASVLALSLLSSGLAVTGEVLDGRPATVMQVITQAGYSAKLSPGDSKTGPSITLNIDGDTVYLDLEGCKADLCTRVNATTGYDADTSSDEVIQYVNDWNLTNYSQAYLSNEEDSAYLDASYLMTGGYTRANLLAWLKAYLDDLTEFANDLP